MNKKSILDGIYKFLDKDNLCIENYEWDEDNWQFNKTNKIERKTFSFNKDYSQEVEVTFINDDWNRNTIKFDEFDIVIYNDKNIYYYHHHIKIKQRIYEHN